MRKSCVERLTDWGASRGLLPPWSRAVHHPVFAAFPPPRVMDGDIDVDYLGVRTQAGMLPSHHPAWPVLDYLPQLPASDEEYFEWIDLLEAVTAAHDRFAMIEIGAGFARWAVRGWAAAQRRGLPAHLGIVEAEPQHALVGEAALGLQRRAGLRRHLPRSRCGRGGGQHCLPRRHAAGSRGQHGTRLDGQAVAWPGLTEGQDSRRSYCGKPLLEMATGWSGVRVEVQTLDAMLGDFSHLGASCKTPPRGRANI